MMMMMMMMMPNNNGGLMPGFCLSPRDEELLRFLLKKVRKELIDLINPNIDIRTEDLYEKEPWLLYQRLNISDSESIENKYYFFTPIKNKNKSGSSKKMERVVGSGQWNMQKTTEVLDSYTGRRIGWKRFLNFQVNGKNTNPSWIMHEYTLINCNTQAICRIGWNNKNNNLQENPIKLRTTCNNENKKGAASKHQHSGKMLHTNGFYNQPLHQQQPFSICEPSSSTCQQQPFSVASSSNSAFLEQQNRQHQSSQSHLESIPTTSSNPMTLHDLDHCRMEGDTSDMIDVDELLGPIGRPRLRK